MLEIPVDAAGIVVMSVITRASCVWHRLTIKILQLCWRTGEQAGGQASGAPLRPPKPGLAAGVLSCLQLRGTSEVRSICRSLWPEAEKEELPKYEVRVRDLLIRPYTDQTTADTLQNSADAVFFVHNNQHLSMGMLQAQVIQKAGGGRRTQHHKHVHDSKMHHRRNTCVLAFMHAGEWDPLQAGGAGHGGLVRACSRRPAAMEPGAGYLTQIPLQTLEAASSCGLDEVIT